MANIAYQYRLYPDLEQAALFVRTFGCCRKVWNLMLSDKIEHYASEKKMLQTTPAQYKKDYPYLKEVDSLALANVQLQLQGAFRKFFSEPNIGFPKFKSRKSSRASYTTNLVRKNIRISDRGIKLPKTGFVRAKIHRKAPDGYQLKSVTIFLDQTGRFYASVLYEYEEDTSAFVPSETMTHIGLDYKSDGLYVDSEGNACRMPHYYRQSEKQLARAQRRLSRKQKGSANREKQRKRVAKIQQRTANRRKDFLHKTSAAITKRYDVISVESLDMKAMSASLRLGKATMDNGYGMFCSMLAYKQVREGHILVRVEKHFPSSQLCSCCGYKNPVTKDLSIRKIRCPKCGTEYDRDINAAINIDREGVRLLTCLTVSHT